MRWIDNQTLKIGNILFFVTIDSEVYTKFNSTEKHFLLLKGSYQIDRYVELGKELKIKKMLELGVWQGGSAVFFHELYHPAVHLAIEKSEAPAEALLQYIKRKSLSERLLPFFGTDQSDAAKLRAILLGRCPNRDLDLVVDDASHLWEETRSSFNTIFPFMRPGGIYVIEDWAWAHWDVPLWQKPGGLWSDKPPLTNLLFEIAMLAGTRPDIVSEITMRSDMALIRRGATPLKDDFDVSTSYLSRGRKFTSSL